MRIDTRGVELTPPTAWIDKEAKYLFKIIEWKEDGYTQYGDAMIKMFFKTSTGEMHSERFPLSAAALWRLKQLEVALKAPEVYELDSFVGRYVIGDVKIQKGYANVKSWEYASQNDKLDPFPDLSAEAQAEEETQEEAEELF
jgi:hypothetical protein